MSIKADHDDTNLPLSLLLTQMILFSIATTDDWGHILRLAIIDVISAIWSPPPVCDEARTRQNRHRQSVILGLGAKKSPTRQSKANKIGDWLDANLPSVREPFFLKII